MTPYAGLPILVLFGDYVDEFPRWAPRLKNCRAFVAATNAAGGKAELLVLPEIGIRLDSFTAGGVEVAKGQRQLGPTQIPVLKTLGGIAFTLVTRDRVDG